MLNTAAGWCFITIRSALHTASGNCSTVRSVCFQPTRFKPPISTYSIGKLSFGTSLLSIPSFVPTKNG